MLRRDVLVGQRVGLRARGLEQLRHPGAEPGLDLSAREHLGDPVERLADAVTERFRLNAELLQQRVDDSLGIREQREQDVLRDDLLLVPRQRLLVGTVERGARLHRQLVEVHLRFPLIPGLRDRLESSRTGRSREAPRRATARTRA